MRQPSRAGWVYILQHNAWDTLGALKVGMTARHPATRMGEITRFCRLRLPGRIAYVVWVADRRAVEAAVHQRLRAYRIRHWAVRRELFRTDVATAIAAIEQARGYKRLYPVVAARAVRHSKQPLIEAVGWTLRLFGHTAVVLAVVYAFAVLAHN